MTALDKSIKKSNRARAARYKRTYNFLRYFKVPYAKAERARSWPEERILREWEWLIK